MDVHVPYAITTGLRLRGIDVLTSQEDHTTQLSDPDLLERASGLGRALFTQDRDFLRIASEWQQTGRSFAGIVYGHLLRATFYRWAQTFPEACPELMAAPEVLAVSDLHIENFGTWRDAEGRLIWGVNDFDEASALPYTNDLLRLAVSAGLAISANDLDIDHKDACEAILEGYREGFDKGGRPFVLAERHKTLREMASGQQRDPAQYWQKLEGLPAVSAPPPAAVEEAIRATLPEAGIGYRVVRRVAGLGSLGRPRYAAIADWRGGCVAREVKALVPSAAAWAQIGSYRSEVLYQTILDGAARCPDPTVQVRENWLVRRLAPDCIKIELSDLARSRDMRRLLEAMGKETANIHIGMEGAGSLINQDWRARPTNWLHKAAKKMAEITNQEWEEWRKVS
jgi:hypothetical protein